MEEYEKKKILTELKNIERLDKMTDDEILEEYPYIKKEVLDSSKYACLFGIAAGKVSRIIKTFEKC